MLLLLLLLLFPCALPGARKTSAAWNIMPTRARPPTSGRPMMKPTHANKQSSHRFSFVVFMFARAVVRFLLRPFFSCLSAPFWLVLFALLSLLALVSFLTLNFFLSLLFFFFLLSRLVCFHGFLLPVLLHLFLLSLLYIEEFLFQQQHLHPEH